MVEYLGFSIYDMSSASNDSFISSFLIWIHFVSFFLKSFIYLTVLGLSCGTWDLCCVVQGSFMILREFSSCGVVATRSGKQTHSEGQCR